MLGLEKCTEDEARNPPLVLAVRHLPKHLFEEGIAKEDKEPTPKREDDADKQISKLPETETKSKTDDVPEKGEDKEPTPERGNNVDKQISKLPETETKSKAGFKADDPPGKSEDKEPTPERGDSADKQISKLPETKTKSKADFKADDVPGKSGFQEKATAVGKDAKPKKERIEKPTAEKDQTGKVETTFHVLLQYKVNVNSQNDAGVTALHAACERGVTAMVKELLSCESIEINKKDEQQNTPMHTACVSGEKDVVFTLIEHGANVMEENNDKMTPLHVAVVERKLEIVKIILKCADDKKKLLQAKEKDGNSPFLLAVKTGDEEMVKFFLDNGANVADTNANEATALHLATSLNKVKIMELVYVDGDGNDLLDKIDNDECTPLHFAAKYNQIDALKFLLNK